MPRRSCSRLRALAAAGAALVALACAHGTAPAVGARPTPTTAADTAPWIGRARQLLRDSIAANGTPGASIAVSLQGRLIWAEGFGYADVQTKRPVTPATLFRIGSVSKTLTAVGLARLVEDGKIAWDSSVYRYATDFPRKPWDFTVRQVAGHLSGIRHYRGNEFLMNHRYATVREALPVFENDSLLFRPGTRYGYSSYGYNLLSYVMERASGKPFLRYMHERVFRPLGMTETAPDRADSIIAARTTFYVKSGTTWNVAPPVDNSVKWAGGGFLSTPRDLARLGAALADGKLLQPATRQVLWTSQHTSDGTDTHYGMGFYVLTDSGGRRVVFHSGSSIGGSTHVLIYPDQRVVIALASNSSEDAWIGLGTMARQIGELMLGAVSR